MLFFQANVSFFPVRTLTHTMTGTLCFPFHIGNGNTGYLDIKELLNRRLNFWLGSIWKNFKYNLIIIGILIFIMYTNKNKL